jgi:hypothetical protein
MFNFYTQYIFSKKSCSILYHVGYSIEIGKISKNLPEYKIRINQNGMD